MSIWSVETQFVHYTMYAILIYQKHPLLFPKKNTIKNTLVVKIYKALRGEINNNFSSSRSDTLFRFLQNVVSVD